MPLAAAPPFANAGEASHIALSCTRSKPARESRERALSPRERQASECTKSGVPSTDPKAAGPGAHRTFARKRVRGPVERALRACVKVAEADDEPS